MGRTVAELSATMSREEFLEWNAYYDVEPFGSPAEDDRARHIVSILYAAYGGNDDVRWFDRDPEWTAHLDELNRPPLDDTIEAFFEARLQKQAKGG